MRPRVGKGVHYRSRGSADGVFAPECRAAIITKVRSPLPEALMAGDVGYSVDLAILSDGGLFFDQDLAYNEDLAPGTWHYADHDDEPPPAPPDEAPVPARPVS